jgi:hypothetical protein
MDDDDDDHESLTILDAGPCPSQRNSGSKKVARESFTNANKNATQKWRVVGHWTFFGFSC